MLRGPTYDDSYISRKLSHMPGPTFTAPSRGYLQGYPSLAPTPRYLHHRLPPSYYDYDYGYGYGGYYGYVPPPVRMSRYDTYLEDDLPEPTFLPRYRPRVSDVLDDVDYREKSLPPTTTTTTDHIRSYSPGAAVVPPGEGRSRPKRAALSSHDLEGERHLHLPSHRYPSLSEPQMLHDHVDKMRIRLKSLAYSLDPSGPVPEIIVPDRPKKASAADDKKYSSALEFTELPKLASRRQRYYPEDQHLKDNLRIQCLSHYKTTRTAADYWKPKQYIPTEPLKVMPDSSRYSKFSSTKWEEPDTVFGAPSDKKPFSKNEGGSPAEEVVQAVTDGTTEEANEEKKERRKKKKSKERDTAGEAVAALPAAAPSDVSASEVEAVSAPSESEPIPVSTELPVEEEVLDEKERKRLEKKKRKAEREAAAKAAMEAELAALAAAEAELARLEAESSALKPDAPTPAEVPAPAAPDVPAPADIVPAPTEPADPPAEPAAEVKSESAAEKCESSTEVVCEGVCVPPGEPVPSHPPRHLPLQEDHESHHQTQQLPAIQEPLPAPEPPLEEPQAEPPIEMEPPVEEPNVELPEESQLEAQLEIPVHEPKAEDLQLESLVEPQAEEARLESPAEKPHAEETQAEPPVEEPQVEEPKMEPPVEVPQVEIPQVEAQMEAPYVKDPVAVVKEAPVVESSVEKPRLEEAGRAEDAGWLDAWAGEAAAAGAADETGQLLGAEVSSGDLATTHGGPHDDDDDDDDDPAH